MILSSSWCQLLVLSYLYFSNIGMWNALNTIGGLGTGDERISHSCNTILYGVGLIGGFFSGSAVNYFGQRLAALIGSCAQSLLLATVYAVHYYNWSHFAAYVASASVIGGLLIGWLLASVASGLVQLPTEEQRSLFLAIASGILNLGGVLGGAISLGMNFNGATGDQGLSNASFLSLLCVCFSGIIVSFLIQPPEKIIKSDGTHPTLPHVDPREELKGIAKGLSEPYLWLMVPLYMCSMWHEVILFNFFNMELFNVRSRAMNTIYYYLGRVVFSFVFQWVCDYSKILTHRITAATLFTALMCAIGFTSAILTLADVGSVRSRGPLDFTEHRSGMVAIAFLAYGGLETIGSSFSFWLIGVLPFNDPAMENRFVGWFRVASSFGAFLSWLIDSTGKVSDNVQWILSACLWVVALLSLFVLKSKVKRAPEKESAVAAAERSIELINAEVAAVDDKGRSV